MSRKIVNRLRAASKPVRPGNEDSSKREKLRSKADPKPIVVDKQEPTTEDLENAHLENPKVKEFVEIQVQGSKGTKYTIVVPKSLAKGVPNVWEWTADRYKVAELIAQGVPYSQIPEHPGVQIKSRMTIYCWLNHPEFREHVDALVMETGFANKRERIAGLTRVTQLLFDKLTSEIGGVKITDKSLGAIISGLQQISKQLAQEKEEFVEHQNVAQQTTVEGKIAVATVNVDQYIQSQPTEERQKLEQEFDNIGNDIIRTLTGGNE